MFVNAFKINPVGQTYILHNHYEQNVLNYCYDPIFNTILDQRTNPWFSELEVCNHTSVQLQVSNYNFFVI